MKQLPVVLIFLGIAFMYGPLFTAASSPTLTIFPKSVIQGEPVLITLEGVSSTSTIQSLLFETTSLPTFVYNGTVQALVGIDLHKKPRTYQVSLQLTDGTTLQKDIFVAERPQIKAPLGIPEKLGGNTTQSAQTLISTLASENASLATIRTGTKGFWNKHFVWPLALHTVTDPYGYSRETGGYFIAHKGTDFRAVEGTSVMAINRGIVRVVKTYRDYGKTVVIDHGLGLMSMYMHLSKIVVNPGELVLPGEIIGKSGHTGYADQPHLHLSIRINGISIDPIKFFALFASTTAITENSSIRQSSPVY